MDRPLGIALAAVVGTAAVVAPIWISIDLARLQSLAVERSRVRITALEVLRHTEESALQDLDVYNKLVNDHLPPCSPAEIDLMRSIDLASTYVQAVGRLQGDTLICNSLGSGDPIPLGPSTLKSDFGADERPGLRLAIAGDHPLNVISKNGVAVIYDPMLLLETPGEGSGISVEVVVPSGPRRETISSLGEPGKPEWLKSLSKGGAVAFEDSGFLVYAVRSRIADIEVVAAIPLSFALRRQSQFAIIFVPVGLLCGALLAWANFYVWRKRLSLAAILRAAIRRHEFYVEYQPIVELKTSRWIGAEALVRWRRGKRVIRPDIFIPIAEETGVITGITASVFEQVARDLPAFLAADPDFRVAINLSATDLGNPETLTLVDRTLLRSGARPANLEVEATERGLLHGDDARHVVNSIRARGVAVAIDDFGTGYSSLSRLQELSLDVLKIDKSFVDSVDTEIVTSQVILHIIEIAQSLHLEMVAEGVETERQRRFLVEHGVQFAQGWLFARPMPAESLCHTLAAAELVFQ